MYFTTSILRAATIIGLVYLLLLSTSSVYAQTSGESPKPASSSSNITCVKCGPAPQCNPACPSNKICILDLQTCTSCSVAKCQDVNSVNNVPVLLDNANSNDSEGNAKIVPAVVGSVLGVAFLGAIAFVFIRLRGRRNNDAGFFSNGEKLSSTDSRAWHSVDSENVIPIAYIPPSTSTASRPLSAYTRARASQISVGTTPLGSPLPGTFSDDKLFNIADDEEATDKAVTVVTATRAKPALVRLNTIKSNSLSDLKSRPSNRKNSNAPPTPKTPQTGNTLLSVHSYGSSVPSTPSTFHSVSFEDEGDTMLLPRIDVERSSQESSRSINNDTTNASSQNNLVSPFLDPIDGGRQSFGLFGSDEVDSSGTSSPNLQRESMISSTSSNPRSTMMSDEGDGEIMIFWGGSSPSFLSNDPRNPNSGTANESLAKRENHVKDLASPTSSTQQKNQAVDNGGETT